MRKIFLTILLILSPYLSMAYEKEIASLSSIMAESITKAGKKTVAVVDFVDLQGNITELGMFIGEELSIDLVTKAENFEVIDRIHLKTILTEYKISIPSLIDPKIVKRLGEIAGVDAIITGCVIPLRDGIRVTCKLITTDTVKVIGAGKKDITKTKAIEELFAKGITTQMVTRGRPIPTLSKSKAQQSIEISGFIFELQSCKLSGGNVICDFLVTNKKEDRDLRIFTGKSYGKSRIFDDSGNEYYADSIQLGNKESTGYVNNLFVSGIPTKMSLSFNGVSKDAKSVALLEIHCDKFIVQFRDIPLDTPK